MSDPKSEYRRTANRIGELELERRAAIMAGDDKGAEQIDFDLFAAKLRLKRLADKIEWLEQERHKQTGDVLPDTVPACTTEIQENIKRIALLEGLRYRSAVEDHELDRRRSHRALLEQRRELAARMS
jgi:hypothetical protein